MLSFNFGHSAEVFLIKQSSNYHNTVLLDEAVAALNIKPDGCYMDATLGRGGHTQAILNHLDERGCVLGLDRDPSAIDYVKNNIGLSSSASMILYHNSFSKAESCLNKYNNETLSNKKLDGLLLDLGVSSPQLDTAERGFSFQSDGPLDMRMDTSQGETAAEWLAEVTEDHLADVLLRYGEERFARKIARTIVTERAIKPIVTTAELASLVQRVVPNPKFSKRRGSPFKKKPIHPATKTFQAIRIEINQELAELTTILEQSLRILAPGGRLVVISFHSLEDRIVKRFMQKHAKGDDYPANLPILASELTPEIRLCSKAIRASDDDIAINPRARSAIMRVAERLEGKL